MTANIENAGVCDQPAGKVRRLTPGSSNG